MGRRNEDANEAEQLSFAETASEEPVGYRLTARARRVVAPTSLPDLAVVPGAGGHGGEALDLHDARPPRARALRRSGRSVEEVAAALDVATDLVADWCRGVAPRRRRRRVHGPAAPPESVTAVSLDTAERAAAVGGFVAALAELTRHSVTFTVSEQPAAAAVVAWLTTQAGADVARLRIILEVGRGRARDLIAHAWAQELGVPLDHITATVWEDAPSPKALRVTIRVADPKVASVVAGWRAALLSVDVG